MPILIKGVFIGMMVSFPIGPLGIMSIQRTINKGRRIGFLSGVGAAASDIVYSLCAVFGLSFIDEFINKHKYLINNITGLLFLILGIKIYISTIGNKVVLEDKKRFEIHPGISSFLLGLSNPMTFLIFITIFTKMGLKLNAEDVSNNLLFILSIFTGSSILWFIVCNLINNSRKNLKIETFSLINKIIGASIALFGIYSIFIGVLHL